MRMCVRMRGKKNKAREQACLIDISYNQESDSRSQLRERESGFAGGSLLKMTLIMAVIGKLL